MFYFPFLKGTNRRENSWSPLFYQVLLTSFDQISEQINTIQLVICFLTICFFKTSQLGHILKRSLTLEVLLLLKILNFTGRASNQCTASSAVCRKKINRFFFRYDTEIVPLTEECWFKRNTNSSEQTLRKWIFGHFVLPQFYYTHHSSMQASFSCKLNC